MFLRVFRCFYSSKVVADLGKGTRDLGIVGVVVRPRIVVVSPKGWPNSVCNFPLIEGISPLQGKFPVVVKNPYQQATTHL